MLYIINAFSGNVNVLSVNILFSHRIIIETEMIRAVAGLGVLKHYAVTVIRLAADDSDTVVVPDIQVEIFFIDLCHFFDGHDPFAVDDRHVQRFFQIFIDGMLCDLFCQSRYSFFEKIVVVDDQRNIVEIMDSLNIINFGIFRKAGENCLLLGHMQFCEQSDMCVCLLTISCGRFCKSLNFHHLKVDYKNGDKWSFMEPDRMALKKLFEEWQEGMQEANGWNSLFWCNHDQPRVVSRFGDEKNYWKESAKMLAASVHMMRGTPYIYQGEELGMINAHYSDISQYRDVESLNYYEILLSEGKSKEEALEILAAKSRDNSRTPMQWSADVNAGFSEAEPWISVIDNYKEINAEKEMQDPDSIYSFYKKLVGLRKEKAVISEGTIEFFERENADVLAYKRNYKEEELVVFNNLIGGKIVFQAKPEWKTYHKLLGNYEKEYEIENGGEIILEPYETLVLEK